MLAQPSAAQGTWREWSIFLHNPFPLFFLFFCASARKKGREKDRRKIRPLPPPSSFFLYSSRIFSFSLGAYATLAQRENDTRDKKRTWGSPFSCAAYPHPFSFTAAFPFLLLLFLALFPLESERTKKNEKK